ncbi:hypothetical protein OIU78_018638 [Salix suchowensis]|nr:hypothetical protein OIU78_018638 [Salix suchowensis]
MHEMDMKPLRAFNKNAYVSRSIGDVYLKKPEFNRDPIYQQFGNPIPLKRPVMTAEPSIARRKLRWSLGTINRRSSCRDCFQEP